jgi:hypothetical protein
MADCYCKVFDFDVWCISDDIFHFFFQPELGSLRCRSFLQIVTILKLESFSASVGHHVLQGLTLLCFNSWIVSPVSLMPNVHLQLCKASGIIIVLKWTSSQFWSMLVNSDGNFIQIFCHWLCGICFSKQDLTKKVFLLEQNFYLMYNYWYWKLVFSDCIQLFLIERHFLCTNYINN